MNDLRQAAQRLLDAVDKALPYAPHRSEFDVVADTADDLRAALVEQVPLEPDIAKILNDNLWDLYVEDSAELVGEVVSIEFHEEFGAEAIVSLHQDVELGAKLYTNPAPQRQPLTEEEIAKASAGVLGLPHEIKVELARAVEAAHRIGGQDGQG